MHRTIREDYFFHLAGKVKFLNILVANICAETLSLCTNIRHEFGALNTFNKTREILNFGGVHKSTTGGYGAGKQHG